MSHPQIRNLDQLEYKPFGHGERYRAQHAPVSQLLGAQKLGFGVVVLPPGKRAWPYHLHLVNEELFVILEGEGTLRMDGQELPVRAGDLISCPPGQHSAHQLINTSEQELKYLAISTRESPEIVKYPDTQKTLFSATTVAEDGSEELIRGLYTDSTPQAGYWDGE